MREKKREIELPVVKIAILAIEEERLVNCGGLFGELH